MRIPFTLILFLAFQAFSIGQSQLAIGEWATHLPFPRGLSVTQSPRFVYYSTDYAILKMHKVDRTYEFLTTNDGLSRTEGSVLMYHPISFVLVVGYESGIIDLVRTDGVRTMKDIYSFDNFPIDKKINHLYPDGKDRVIVSGNFGMSLIDVRSEKVLWTSFTFGNQVYGVTRVGDMFYAGTEDGLFRIQEDAQVENFASWEKVDEAYGIPGSAKIGALTTWNERLYVGADSTLFGFVDSTNAFETIYSKEDFEIIGMSNDHGRLLVTFECLDDCNSVVVDFNSELEAKESSNHCSSRSVNAIEDERGYIWYADRYQGFRVAFRNGQGCQFYRPNSPYSANMNEVAVGKNFITIASGGTKNNFAYSFRNDGFFILDEAGSWSAYNIFNTDELDNKDSKGFHRAKIQPGTGDRYYGTYWGGIVVYHQDGGYTFYDESNSALRQKDENDPRERVIGMEFNKEGDLWVATFLAPENALSVRLNDGTWIGFDPPDFGGGPNEVAIDSSGNKWVTMTGDGGKGVYVFNEGEINDPSDDEYYIYSQNNSELPTNQAISVTVDLDGDVWVGTDQGPVVFECGSDLFEGGCMGNRRKVEQDTIIAFLLETEEIRCIAVDGANRKWFGTRNGVFVQSASGEEQVLSFNEENSPLLSNTINDIAIDNKDGYVYIATEKGLNVYRTDAVLGGQSHAPQVVAYPNPVRPGYNGPIAIKGLPRDANVKITDISGTMIYETTSNGGQAIWDGKDYNGVRAKSGIYLVFSTSDGGAFESPEALVTKILIVN